ncbi:MAG: nitrogenase [Methanospirillum sp.]|nr:nitrogenase [Methanospirillum sp.]
MFHEIAAVIGNDGRSTRLTESGTVVVYRRSRSSWQPVRKTAFSVQEGESLAVLRKKMADLISFLGDCRIFAAQAASGALYYELVKAGCSVFEAPGRPDEFLEDILEEEEKERSVRAAARNEPVPGPYEQAPGKYFVSIKEIQGKNPGTTSKQILQEFVSRGSFARLEIICDHVPPWIEMEAERREYSIETEKSGENEVRVVLTNPLQMSW